MLSENRKLNKEEALRKLPQYFEKIKKEDIPEIYKKIAKLLEM